jgi:hypothetical protein
LKRLLTERYRERLAGVLSCYDRIIVTGPLPGACYADGMTAFLSARQVRIFDYPRFAEPLRSPAPIATISPARAVRPSQPAAVSHNSPSFRHSPNKSAHTLQTLSL